MAEGTQNIGGISVDIIANDEQVQRSLEALEKRLESIEHEQHIVQIKFVEQGKPSAKGKPNTVQTTLALEKDAETKLIAKLKNIEVPIKLKLASGAVEALKNEINEAFANFAIKVKLNYEEEGETIPGTGGRARFSPSQIATHPPSQVGGPVISDREWMRQMLHNKDAMRELASTMSRVKDDYKKASATPGGADRQLKNLYEKATRYDSWGDLTKVPPSVFARYFRPGGSVGSDAQESTEVVVPAGPRVRIPSKLRSTRRATRTTEIQRAVEDTQRAAEIVAPPIDYGAGANIIQNPTQLYGPHPEELYDTAARTEQAMVGRPTGGPNKFGPRYSEERGPLRRRAGIRGRRTFPLRGVGVQARRGLEFVRNPRLYGIQGSPVPIFDPRGILPAEPELQRIATAFLKGQFGTREEPFVEDIATGTRSPVSEDLRNFIVRQGIATNPQRIGNISKEFRGPAGQLLRIVRPDDIARERAAAAGVDLNAIPNTDLQKFLDILNSRTGTSIGAPGGLTRGRRPLKSVGTSGFIGVSTGTGGAYRSRQDLEPGQLSQQRVQGFNVRDLWETMSSAERALVNNLPVGQRDDYILQHYSIEGRRLAAEKAMMAAAPESHGFTGRGFEPLKSALEKFYAGDTDISDLPEKFQPEAGRPVGIALATRLRVRAAEKGYKPEFGVEPPESFKDYAASIREIVDTSESEKAKAARQASSREGRIPRADFDSPDARRYAANQETKRKIEAAEAPHRPTIDEILRDPLRMLDFKPGSSATRPLLPGFAGPVAYPAAASGYLEGHRIGPSSIFPRNRAATGTPDLDVNVPERTVLGGDEFVEAFRRQLGRYATGRSGPLVKPTTPEKIQEHVAKIRAGRLREAAATTPSTPTIALEKAASEVEPHGLPIGPGGPTGGKTELEARGGGGSVDVRVIASVPIEVKGLSGSGSRLPMASSEFEATVDPRAIRTAATALQKRYPKAAQDRIAEIVAGQGFNRTAVEEALGIIPPTEAARGRSRSAILSRTNALFPDLGLERYQRPAGYKSDAQIAAEAQILEARTFNPTRSFVTAVGAAFQKTLGGGAAFERRVREYQRALKQNADAIDALSGINDEIENIDTGLGKIQKQASQGKLTKKESRQLVEAETSLTSRRKELEASKPEAESRVAAAGAEVEAKGGLTLAGGVTGVVRSFGLLGLGAIVGREIFTLFINIANEGTRAFVEGLSKAEDALTGFTQTTARANLTLAGGIQGTGGNVGAALLQLAGPSISSTGLGGLGALGVAGSALAASQTTAQIGQVLNANARDQADAEAHGGYARQLFEGTGGVLNTGFGPGATPGLAENVALYAPQTGQDIYQQIFDAIDRGFGTRTSLGTTGQTTPAYLAELNNQLKKANSGFQVLTNATDTQKKAFLDSANAIGEGGPATQLGNVGIIFGTSSGQALSGTQFGQALQDLATGYNTVDLQTAAQQIQPQLNAQLEQIQRQQQHQLSFTLPVQAGISQLQNPLISPTSYFSTGGSQFNLSGTSAANDQSKYNDQLKQTEDIQSRINAYAQQGQEIIKNLLPQDLIPTFNQAVDDSAKIASLTQGINMEQADLQAAEYANQLRIAQRSLGDIKGLMGQTTGQGATYLGQLEREQVLLQRQSQELSFQLQQRQINLSLATAGFQQAGETPAEVAARQEAAIQQAKIQQQQLNIQKSSFQVGIKIFDENNLRQFTDIGNSIKLLEQGRKVTLDTTAAQKQIDALHQDLQNNINQINTAVSANEAKWSAASSALTSLEAQYKQFIGKVSTDTADGIISFLQSVASQIPDLPGVQTNVEPGGGTGTFRYNLFTGSGSTSTSGTTVKPKLNAAGDLFNTTGVTPMIVGEAGTETVAILRNPRQMAMSSGGGTNNFSIVVNNPIVRNDNDIMEIARQVEAALNKRIRLAGLR